MARQAKDEGGQLAVKKFHFDQLLKIHKQFQPFANHWRWNNAETSPVKISVRFFTNDALEALLAILRADGKKADNWMIGQVRAHLEVRTNPTGAVVKSLRAGESAMIAFIKKDIMRGWLFRRDDKTQMLQAWQVNNVAYVPAVVTKDYTHPPFIKMQLKSWGKNDTISSTVTWYIGELGKTCSEMLADKLLFKESKELLAEYDKNEDEFLKWRKMLGEQFVGKGTFTSKDDQGWHREHDSEMHGVRLIVDDACHEIENRQQTMLFSSFEVTDDDEVQNAEDDEEEIKAAQFSQVPLQFYIFVFNLDSYRGGWVHQGQIKEYIYRPELRDKLILPPEHADIIDALTADMDVLMEDIISGKSGGTTIMCQGKAGTGKTLTAEIYSEIIKRPLYRVHSGQLGTDAESVEEALKTALNNAKRWRAILLIDEADVFVSERGDDLEKNAVISVFLRVLEYFDGVLFMTTNRLDAIDDAILSRCIATIKFELPSEAERERLWLTLGGVYGLDLVKTKGMAKKLAERFECTGRDIKGLTKLVTKYARQRGRKIEFADFERMAIFRGL